MFTFLSGEEELVADQLEHGRFTGISTGPDVHDHFGAGPGAVAFSELPAVDPVPGIKKQDAVDVGQLIRPAAAGTWVDIPDLHGAAGSAVAFPQFAPVEL